jgi:hypothetical protein
LRVFGEFSDTKIFNLFVQRTAGDYYFDSIADFQAGNAQRFRYQNAVPSLNPDDAAARFRYQTFTFGIQDTWRLNDMLTLAYGARYDVYGGDSRPALNQNFVNRYGFTNTAYIDGRGIFQPRVGLDFKPTSDLTIRAGGGIFSGGSPDVYVSNSFSNTGFLSNSIDVRRNNDGSITGADVANGNAVLNNVNGSTIPAIPLSPTQRLRLPRRPMRWTTSSRCLRSGVLPCRPTGLRATHSWAMVGISVRTSSTRRSATRCSSRTCASFRPHSAPRMVAFAMLRSRPSATRTTTCS